MDAAISNVDGDACGSDIPSAAFGSEIHSGFLDNYGLDGPLPSSGSAVNNRASTASEAANEVPSHASVSSIRRMIVQNPPPAAAEAPLQILPAIPSMSGSTNTRKRRKEELKQATIKQHYYPEGGWGWVVVLTAFLVQVVSHGFQMSFGVILVLLTRRWGDEATEKSGKNRSTFSYFCWLGCVLVR